MPLLGLEIPSSHPSPSPGDRMEIIPDRSREVPGIREVGRCRQGILVQIPVEESRCVLGVILGIAPGGQVAEDAPTPFSDQSTLGPAKAELSLADAGRPRQDGQRPRQESSAQRLIQFFQSKPMASNGHSSLTKSAAACAASRTVRTGSIVLRPPKPRQGSLTRLFIPDQVASSEIPKQSIESAQVALSGMSKQSTESARSGDSSGFHPENIEGIARRSEIDFVSSYMVAVSGKPCSRGRSGNIDSGRSSGCSQQPDGVNESTRKVVREKTKNNQSGGRLGQSRQEAKSSAQGARVPHLLLRDDIGCPGRSTIGPVGFQLGLPSRLNLDQVPVATKAPGATALLNEQR